MFDLPLPFNPVIALNCGSKPETVVRVAYDLKPSITICLMYIFKQKGYHEHRSVFRRLVARSWRQNLPRGLCCQWIISTQPTRTKYPGYTGFVDLSLSLVQVRLSLLRKFSQNKIFAGVHSYLKVAPHSFTLPRALMTKAQVICVRSKENISVFRFL